MRRALSVLALCIASVGAGWTAFAVARPAAAKDTRGLFIVSQYGDESITLAENMLKQLNGSQDFTLSEDLKTARDILFIGADWEDVSKNLVC